MEEGGTAHIEESWEEQLNEISTKLCLLSIWCILCHSYPITCELQVLQYLGVVYEDTLIDFFSLCHVSGIAFEITGFAIDIVNEIVFIVNYCDQIM